MISNSSREFPPHSQSETDPTNDSAEGKSQIEMWLDDIENHWPKTVKKIRKSEPFKKTGRKQVKQLCFGLSSGLLDQIAPLVDHVAVDCQNGGGFEQLASLAESAASSASQVFQTESLLSEVPDSGSDDFPQLAAISILLVASRLREVVLNGSDQEFERIVRSIHAMQSSAIENEISSPLLFQWLAIELPLTLAKELLALKPLKKEGKLAAKRFVNVTRQLLDSDGWPNSGCLRQFGPLAASWTRCVNLAADCKFKLGSSFHAQMEWVAEQFVRLHGPGKKLLFAPEGTLASKKSFVEFVVSLDSDGRARKLAEEAKLIRAASSKAKAKPASAVEPTCISEWAASAILKGSWRANSPAVGLDFANNHCRLEVAAKEKLISGSLAFEVRDDGQPVEFDEAGFEVVCDLVDDEVAYLELELKHPELKLFRQIMLSKKDRFLFFADSVLKDGAGEIDYRLKIPLAKGINVIRENGTRELYLNRPGKGIQSLVLPLSLPEWTAERCRGLLSADEDDRNDCGVLNFEKAIELSDQGGALYCPMFIDLDPNRSRLKRTWRSLTVAENLGIVRPEVAAAYRVQVDEDQWVFYRALQAIGNRTFMGQNFAGDFFAAKFFRNGQIQELVEVE